jgi:hypothetical protein
MLTTARTLTRVVVPKRHGLPVPKAYPAVRMHTRSEALSGSGVSQLASRMEPFAGTNCYYLLVSETAGSCLACLQYCTALCLQLTVAAGSNSSSQSPVVLRVVNVQLSTNVLPHSCCSAAVH